MNFSRIASTNKHKEINLQPPEYNGRLCRTGLETLWYLTLDRSLHALKSMWGRRESACLHSLASSVREWKGTSKAKMIFEMWSEHESEAPTSYLSFVHKQLTEEVITQQQARWLCRICWISQRSGVERAEAIWELTWKYIKSSRRRWEGESAAERNLIPHQGKKHSNYPGCVSGKFIPKGNGGPRVQKLCTWHCIPTCHKNYFHKLEELRIPSIRSLGDEKQH